MNWGVGCGLAAFVEMRQAERIWNLKGGKRRWISYILFFNFIMLILEIISSVKFAKPKSSTMADFNGIDVQH